MPEATGCVCGPGPIGGRGWRADCPRHNVRELLKAPPQFDPTTIAARVAALTEENTMPNPRTPEDYTHGLGEMIRAHRLFIGLSQRDMAARLHRDRRDYQRIESGRDACPPGLLGEIEDLSDDFAHQVEMVLDEADRRDPADGPLTLAVVTDGNAADEWLRLVAGRAAVEATQDHPIVLVSAPADNTSQVG